MKYRYELGKLAVTLDTEMSFADGEQKRWVSVEFPDGTVWVPAFRDYFYQLNLIGWCEDVKYPNGRGRFLVRDFLRDALEPLRPGQTLDDRWQELRARYEIPERNW